MCSGVRIATQWRCADPTSELGSYGNQTNTNLNLNLSSNLLSVRPQFNIMPSKKSQLNRTHYSYTHGVATRRQRSDSDDLILKFIAHFVVIIALFE